jgi:hypothetical protein
MVYLLKHCVVLLCVCLSAQDRNQDGWQNQCETFVRMHEYTIPLQRVLLPLTCHQILMYRRSSVSLSRQKRIFITRHVGLGTIFLSLFEVSVTQSWNYWPIFINAPSLCPPVTVHSASICKLDLGNIYMQWAFFYIFTDFMLIATPKVSGGSSHCRRKILQYSDFNPYIFALHFLPADQSLSLAWFWHRKFGLYLRPYFL